MLEVIASNIVDIIEINKSKADRIEFCIELDKGGFTPRIADIKMAVKISKLPIMVILREHCDNYEITNDQLQVIINKINKIKKLGVKGIVYGATTINGEIDIPALKKVISSLDGLELTFHKAFDFVNDFSESVKNLNTLGVKRVLSSGGKGNPWINRKNLKLIKNTNLELLIGGGVNIKNISKLIKLKFNNFHIGRAARVGNSWNNRIDIKKINYFASKISLNN